ncbi:MAG: hypothetical protein EBR95_02545 [Verrucomicrobia bacterium]|nr:hypothetical protein [Verrucomicrobiota bacterium]
MVGAGAGVAATGAGAGAGAGVAATGVGSAFGWAAFAPRSSGLIPESPRRTSTWKLGVRNRMPAAPARAPKRKRSRPRKNAAMGIRSRP